MHSTCRTCLSEISNNNSFVLREDAESLRVKAELSSCIPEIVMDKVINPAMCLKCVRALHSAYEFKTQCLEMDLQIDNYMKNTNCEKLDVSSLHACSAAVKKSIGTSAQDVIEDLNNLLDEALNVPNNFGNIDKVEVDLFGKCLIELREITGNNVTQQPDKLKLKDCVVDCGKLSNHVPKEDQNTKHPLECSVCGCVCVNSKALKNHKMGHNAKLKYACNICNYSSDHRCNYERHITSHSAETPFGCRSCSYRCKNLDLLKRHMRNRHNKRITQYSCEYCRFKIDCESKLNTHVTEHHAQSISVLKKNLKRPVRKSENYLEKSITTAHQSNDPDKPFACYKCDYKGASKKNLKKHIHRHTKNKNLGNVTTSISKMHICTLCPFKTANHVHLTKHMRSFHKK